MRDYLKRDFWFNISVCLKCDVATAKVTMRNLDKGFSIDKLTPVMSKAYAHYKSTKEYLDL